jgi:ABC-type taurine transport system ATPase subunit
VLDILRRREEYALEGASTLDRFPFDVRGLFLGRAPELGAHFSLSAQNAAAVHYDCTLRALAEEEADRMQVSLPLEGARESGDVDADPLTLLEHGLLPLGLEISGGDKPVLIPLSGRYFRRRYEGISSAGVQFLGTSLFSAQNTAALWDEVALTEREEQVLETLRMIEPTVQRVAVLGAQGRRSNVYLQLRGQRQRVPLGSMGEGIRRLFALALAIGTTPRDGSLLVDEIDTGLHHAVMAQMWELVVRAAKQFRFQVFVTTHSLDCLLALSSTLSRRSEFVDDVVVQRLERERDAAVHFSGDELKLAVDKELEIR